MKAVANTAPSIASPQSIAERVGAIDWKQVSLDLDAQGSAMVERLLSAG
jgi:uncharacterized protein